MKKFFEYVGLTVLCLFSYYYTSMLGEYVSDKDTIMVNLEEKDKTLNKNCTEGYINEYGVVLGISGLSINKQKSYENMRGLGYDESLIEYNYDECKINKENNIDKYIIKGNHHKNSVSIIIELDSLKYINSFINISNEKNIELNVLVNDYIFNNNISLLNKYYNEEINLLYTGNNIRKFKEEFNKTFCVYKEKYDLLESCAENEINTIKTSKIFYKDALLNIKNNLEKGDIIILKENMNNLNELSSIINYILSKGMEIISINDLLE